MSFSIWIRFHFRSSQSRKKSYAHRVDLSLSLSLSPSLPLSFTLSLLQSTGLWGAMNSLGAGGSQSPSLVNAANSSTFCLMVVTCFFTSTLVNYTSIKFVLIVGTMGYSVYAASLYTNVKYGNEWFVVLGACLCGSAGFFWSSEGAIVLSYPERNKQGVYLSYWLMYRVGGQLLGGIINLALNASNNEEGSISPNTYLVFIALQAAAPFVAMLLSPPHKVQRKDGSPVYLK